ncbi:hypothetical protein [Paenibacillus sp. YN15]|uniref:hypothetical protein n=1 Tax=Paenibacillus sp. YN15 TaxID=1742774 RepID=UPI000DCE9A7C|nr:hypothetical protein [Paenibacillus sp. YN15]RAV02697.1 hypothetical protein DQG13_09345 [Paenibacillus sp. YN15]
MSRDHYYCKHCNAAHDLSSPIGIRHLRHTLTPQSLSNFLNMATTIPAYEAIHGGIPGVWEGTNAFVREVKIVETLQAKFPHMQEYHSADGLRNWLTERMQVSDQAYANALSRIQGDAAGEVDFVRDMQDDLRSLFTRTAFVRNADGRITSNFPGIDAVEVNRFTGDVMQEFQVKTLRSADSINETLKGFLDNEHYKPTTVLVGPQELIDRAHELGIPNPTKVMGTLQDNLDSAHELGDKILHHDLATGFTPTTVAPEMLGGAAVGAAISVTVSGLLAFFQYQSGRMTLEQLRTKLAKDGLKGAVTGGTLAGLSLFIPGGLIGHGIAFAAGITLRRLLDEAYGDGMFGEVLKLTKAVQANVEMVHHGSVYVARLSEINEQLLAKSSVIIDEAIRDRMQAEHKLQRLEREYHPGGMIVDQHQTAADILSRLDAKRTLLQRRHI